jgi:hypothetical protein
MKAVCQCFSDAVLRGCLRRTASFGRKQPRYRSNVML